MIRQRRALLRPRILNVAGIARRLQGDDERLLLNADGGR